MNLSNSYPHFNAAKGVLNNAEDEPDIDPDRDIDDDDGSNPMLST